MKSLLNKIKVFLNRYNPIEITRLLKCIEKEIYNINKIIGSVRNVDIKLIQKDVELLMNVINKDDDEIKGTFQKDEINNYALDTLVHEIIDNILEVAHTNEDFNDVKEIIKKYIEHVINKDDDEIKKAREEEIFNELEEESRIIKSVLKSRELERAIERGK